MSNFSQQYAYELFDYGRTLYFRKNYEKALEILFLSDELENFYETYYYIYLCFKKLNNPEKALEYIKLCYEYNNISKNYAMIYANELAERKKFKQATEVLKHISYLIEYDEDIEEMLADLKKRELNKL